MVYRLSLDSPAAAKSLWLIAVDQQSFYTYAISLGTFFYIRDLSIVFLKANMGQTIHKSTSSSTNDIGFQVHALLRQSGQLAKYFAGVQNISSRMLLFAR